MKSPIVLINTFSVPKGMEEEFIQKWSETAQFLKNQPGFIETKMHRSLDPDAQFNFINVALWESPEAHDAALSKQEPYEKQLPIQANPVFYNVEVQY